MSPFEPKNGRQSGMSLVELMISVGICGIVALGTSTAWQYFMRASKAHETHETTLAEIQDLMNFLAGLWNVRARPAGGFTPTNKGFVLLDSNNMACIQNCPVLQMTLRRNAGVDTVRFQSRCFDPGAVASRARLDSLGLGISAATAAGCLRCSGGQIPIVQITSNLVPSENRRYPRSSTNGAAQFRINDVLGINACFDQSGFAPLYVKVIALALNTADSMDILNPIRTKFLPFDNFANVNLKPRN